MGARQRPIIHGWRTSATTVGLLRLRSPRSNVGEGGKLRGVLGDDCGGIGLILLARGSCWGISVGVKSVE